MTQPAAARTIVRSTLDQLGRMRRASGFALRPERRPRRLELYGIGLPKSGTHSITTMFAPTYRAAHEAADRMMIELIVDVNERRVNPPAVRRALAQRRRSLNLEVDASQLHAHLIEYILPLSASSRFILTVRDPYTWLDSLVNHSLARDVSNVWARFREFRFGLPSNRHPTPERILEEHGLYTLEGYLRYWRWHIERCLEMVPSNRLMVVRTDELSNRAGQIADFAGQRHFRPRPEVTHSFQAAGRFGLLDRIDSRYVQEIIDDVCGELRDRFFPDLAEPRAAGIVTKDILRKPNSVMPGTSVATTDFAREA